MNTEFWPSKREQERIASRRREIEFLQRFIIKHFAERPEKRYLQEAYKCYTNQAFGAAAVYCGVAVEATLYEKIGMFLKPGWGMKELLDMAKNHNFLHDRRLGQKRISEVEVARYILNTRDLHAHHLISLRPQTRNRYAQVKKD